MVERFRLLFGPYVTPRVQLGEAVADEARDREVIIVSISKGRIPWPIGTPRDGRARSLVVFGALIGTVELFKCDGGDWYVRKPVRAEKLVRPVRHPQPVWFHPF